MRYDLHIRKDVQKQIQSLATRMSQWETQPAVSLDERAAICSRIQYFSHNTNPEKYSVAGVDGSGDFPSVSYSDSFVYVTVAHATIAAVQRRLAGLQFGNTRVFTRFDPDAGIPYESMLPDTIRTICYIAACT
jgi:hypothetical protein